MREMCLQRVQHLAICFFAGRNSVPFFFDASRYVSKLKLIDLSPVLPKFRLSSPGTFERIREKKTRTRESRFRANEFPVRRYAGLSVAINFMQQFIPEVLFASPRLCWTFPCNRKSLRFAQHGRATDPFCRRCREQFAEASRRRRAVSLPDDKQQL